MKKVFLIVIAAMFSLHSFAVKSAHFTEQKITFDEGTIYTTLNVMDQHDYFWNAVNQLFGDPVRELINIKLWEKVNIKGLGDNLTIKISDAVLIHDLDNKSACEKTYESEEEKQALMDKIGIDNNTRVMKISIFNSKGQNLLNDESNQQIAADYFETLFK